MRIIKGLITSVWVAAVLAIGCLLYVRNSQFVSIDLIWLQIPEESLAVVLISAFFLGLVSGIFLTLIATLLSSAKLKFNV